MKYTGAPSTAPASPLRIAALRSRPTGAWVSVCRSATALVTLLRVGTDEPEQRGQQIDVTRRRVDAGTARDAMSGPHTVNGTRSDSSYALYHFCWRPP